MSPKTHSSNHIDLTGEACGEVASPCLGPADPIEHVRLAVAARLAGTAVVGFYTVLLGVEASSAVTALGQNGSIEVYERLSNQILQAAANIPNAVLALISLSSAAATTGKHLVKKLRSEPKDPPAGGVPAINVLRLPMPPAVTSWLRRLQPATA